MKAQPDADKTLNMVLSRLDDMKAEETVTIDLRGKSAFSDYMIPVVADGLKPFTAYAGDADRARAAKMPVIAIVVGGLGVGAAKTVDAILKLPAAVTLAFTPYGSDPPKLAERARAQHHEILLQIPMEPYEYPDNDPGPQTLLTSLSPTQNIDRLQWLMARMV